MRVWLTCDRTKRAAYRPKPTPDQLRCCSTWHPEGDLVRAGPPPDWAMDGRSTPVGQLRVDLICYHAITHELYDYITEPTVNRFVRRWMARSSRGDQLLSVASLLLLNYPSQYNMCPWNHYFLNLGYSLSFSMNRKNRNNY